MIEPSFSLVLVGRSGAAAVRLAAIIVASMWCLGCGSVREGHVPGAADEQPPRAARWQEGSRREALPQVGTWGNPRACLEDYDPNMEYFPERTELRFAEHLAVTYGRSHKLVTLDLPWLGADAPIRYLLVQCGAPRPPGFDDLPMIEVPVGSVVTTSTTEIPHFESLELVDRLIGHVGAEYVSSPRIRRLLDDGYIVNAGQGTHLNLERVIELGPDLVLADNLGEAGGEALWRLEEIGITVVLSPSFLESSPLGRAEWLKLTALLFNREGLASSTFDSIAESYLSLAATSRRERNGPLVLVGAPSGDTWYVPGGRSFVARLIEDAGGRYLWADQRAEGSIPLALEAAFERAVEAEIWIQPSTWKSKRELRGADERFARIPAFVTNEVFTNDVRDNGEGGNDYWETGTARPDLVLADLVAIFDRGPEADHRDLFFHRRLPAE